jgi:hypothetical protein
MTTLYNYNSSGFFTYADNADICQITGNPIMRINSTLIAPPDNIPVGSYALFDVFNGEKWIVFTPEIPVPTYQELAQQQSIAIDMYIAKQIKTVGYDDIGQVAACMAGGQWQAQAQAVNAWIQLCWGNQANIILGSVSYLSNKDAIDALPAFTVT